MSNSFLLRNGVFFITDMLEHGGAENVLSENVKIAKECGFDTFVFSAFHANNNFFSFLLKIFHIFFYIFNPIYFALVFFYLLKRRPTVVHLYNYYHLLTPSILLACFIFKKIFKAKIIYSAHDFHILYPNSGLIYLKKTEIHIAEDRKYLFRRVDQRGAIASNLKKIQWALSYRVFHLRRIFDEIWSPSLFLKDLCLEVVDCPVILVRNPMTVLPTARLVNYEYNEGSKINIIYLGRISKEKGVLKMLLNLVDLKKTSSAEYSINLDIYGQGEEKKRCEEVSKNISIFNVTLHGYVSKELVPSTLSKYKILVMFSPWYENAPLSIIEAGCTGLALLLPNVGGMLELGRMFKLVEFYDVNDVHSFISALDRVKMRVVNKEMQSFVNEDFLSSFSSDTFESKMKKSYYI